MKKILLSGAALALALTAGSAFAADLPSRKGPPMLPPPPMWTGFYVGLNAGGTWAGSNTLSVVGVPLFANPLLPVQTVPSVLASAVGASGTLGGGSNGGFIGGGQIGYNWQFAGSFVAGIEADIQGVANGNSGASATNVTFVTGFPTLPMVTGINTRRNLDYLGTVRGRLGWLFTPTLLAYATGGLAYGGVNSSTSLFQQWVGAFPIGAPYFSAGSFSDTRVGWTVGGGLEWMFRPNWSAKVEYLYYDLGNVTYNAGVLANIVLPPGGAVPTGGLWSASTSQVTTRFDGHIVRAGVNYHFNWGAAPVVAKY